MNLIDKIEETAIKLGNLSNEGWLYDEYNLYSLSPKQIVRGEMYWHLRKQQEKNLEKLHETYT